MLRIFHHQLAPLAFDGTPELHDGRVPFGRKVIVPAGYSEHAAEDAEILKLDRNFADAVEAGFISIQDGAPEAAAEPEPEAVQPVQTEVKASQAPNPLDKTVADFIAMDPETQAAIYPTLTDEEKAAVDAAKAGA